MLKAAQDADAHLNASCNGKGSCGKCKMVLESGKADQRPNPLLSEGEKSKNYILACMSLVKSDLQVRIPEETLEKKLKVAGMGQEATSRLHGLIGEITPMLIKVPLELCEPSLEDPISDLDRLFRGLRKSGIDTGCINVDLKILRAHPDITGRHPVAMM